MASYGPKSKPLQGSDLLLMAMRSIALFFMLAMSLTLTACSEKSPGQTIAAARVELKTHDLASAKIRLKNVLRDSPDNAEARELLGDVLVEEGDLVAAGIEYRKVKALNVRNDIIVPKLAKSMLLAGRNKDLVEEFRQTGLVGAEATASLQSTLAAASLALGDTGTAAERVASALSAVPNYGAALAQKARQTAVAGDYDAALSIVDGIVARDPKDADSWILRGDILLHGKRNAKEAMAAYRRSAEIGGASVAAQGALMAALLREGSLDEAEQQLVAFRKAARKNVLQVQFFEAEIAYRRHRLPEAKERVESVLAVAPYDLQVLQLAGAIELDRGAYMPAENYLKKALEQAPDQLTTRQMLLETYLRSGQSDKAVAHLTASGDRSGIDRRLFPLAGEAYLQRGDFKTAEKFFASDLKSAPNDVRKRTALAISRLGSQTGAGLDELENIARSDTDPTADFTLVRFHVGRKEWDKALAAVDSLERKLPDKPVAANLRGQVLLARNDPAGARKSFEKALSIQPGDVTAAAGLSALDVADGKPDDAKRRFDALLAKDPKNPALLTSAARLAVLRQADGQEVLRLIDDAISAGPSEAVPRLLLVDYLLKTGDAKRALVEAQRAVAAVSANPELVDALGRAQQAAGDLNQAIAAFAKVAGMQPDSPAPHVRLAAAYRAAGNAAAARDSLATALRITPDFLDAQRALIDLQIAAGDFSAALQLAKSIQTQHPDASVGYALEGNIRFYGKDPTGAARAYRDGLRKAPSSQLASGFYSALQGSGKPDEAERFAAAWKVEHPADEEFRYFLADTALARKDYRGAKAAYLDALRLVPGNAVALNNLAWVTQRLNEPGALAYAEKANALSPNQPAILDTVATLLSAKGDHADAIAMQLKAVVLAPKDTGLRLNLARIYVAAGDKSRARSELEALEKNGDSDPRHAEVKALLKTL